MKLENKVIAITGAGGIICSAFAKALAEEGAKVALLDINYDAAKQYADEIGETLKPIERKEILFLSRTWYRDFNKKYLLGVCPTDTFCL